MEDADELSGVRHQLLVDKMKDHNSLQIEVPLLKGRLRQFVFKGYPEVAPIQVTGSVTVYALLYTSFKTPMRSNLDGLFRGLASSPIIFDNHGIDVCHIERIQSDREVAEIYLISKDQH